MLPAKQSVSTAYVFHSAKLGLVWYLGKGKSLHVLHPPNSFVSSQVHHSRIYPLKFFTNV